LDKTLPSTKLRHCNTGYSSPVQKIQVLPRVTMRQKLIKRTRVFPIGVLERGVN
jgi:hypothetical protein